MHIFPSSLKQCDKNFKKNHAGTRIMKHVHAHMGLTIAVYLFASAHCRYTHSTSTFKKMGR